MFYDDYRTMFNPAKKSTTLSRRLLAASGATPLSESEVEGVVARVLAAPKAEAAPKAARVAADKRDAVEAAALPARTLKAFLTPLLSAKNARLLARRVGDEAWIGAVFEGNVVVARVPASAAPWVSTSLAKSSLAVAALRPLSGTGADYSALSAYFSEEPNESDAHTWHDLEKAWVQRERWTRTPVSRGAARVADFAEPYGASYGLNVVLWGNSPSVQMGVPKSIVEPLSRYYDGAFVATDGNRLAIIGTEHAPENRSIIIPRAMFDHSDPKEAWGSGEYRTAAVGPFLSMGRFTEFPDYSQVLPVSGFGAAIRLNEQDMDALRVPARVSLGGLSVAELQSHAGFFTLGDEDARTIRIAVRFVPKGGSVRDRVAFPPRIVGTFRNVPNAGGSDKQEKNGFGPMQLQARFVDEAVGAILANGDTHAVLLLGERTATGPAAIVSDSQVHIVMPYRIEEGYIEGIFADAEKGGVGAVSDARYAGVFSEYPVSTAAFDNAGSSYKALISAAWANVSPKYRSSIKVLPIKGPQGPETWLLLGKTHTTIRLAGALLAKSYYANVAGETDSLLAQITRAAKVPSALSPGDMQEMDATDVEETLESFKDSTIALPERSMAFDSGVAGSLLAVLPDESRYGLESAFVLPNGLAFSTDGNRAFVAPSALPGMAAASIGGANTYALSAAVLYEVAKGAEEVTLGDSVAAAGRVISRREDAVAPDILQVVPRPGTHNAVFKVDTDKISALSRMVSEATKAAKAADFPAPFIAFTKQGKVVLMGEQGIGDSARKQVFATVPASVVAHDYDSGSYEAVALRTDFFLDALRAVKDCGGSVATILLHGKLAPVLVSGSPDGSYSLVMPVRLEN